MDILELVNEDQSYASRPYACHDILPDGVTECSKTFARKSDLVRHRRIHSQDRPYLCEWPGCDRDFIQRSALTVHMRVHTGERPHKCEAKNCDKAFSDSSSLARHRRIHTGKRPYQCQVPSCMKTFCRKTTLTKHIKRNHGIGTESGEASRGRIVRYVYALTSTPSTSPETPSDSGRDASPMYHESHLATPHSQSEEYYGPVVQTDMPLFKAQMFSPFAEHVHQHGSVSEHFDNNKVYLTPPSSHSRHMYEQAPIEYECSPGEIARRYPIRGLPTPSPQPHQEPRFSYPVTPTSQRLLSSRHFESPHVERPLPPSHFSPPSPSPSSHRFPSVHFQNPHPFTTPLPQVPFTAHDAYLSPDPRHRRASSTSALEPNGSTVHSVGLGISIDEKERPRSFSDYPGDEYVLPHSPTRPRRSSSISFPSVSSLPPLSAGYKFSSFITAHLEKMEDEAAQIPLTSPEYP